MRQPNFVIRNRVLALKSDTGVPMQGKVDSPVVMIAPARLRGSPPDMAWTSPSSVAFNDLLLESQAIGLDEHLVIPASFDDSGKVTAKNCALTLECLRILTSSLFHIRAFVCVGADAFRFLFGHGKKPSMKTLGGSILFLPELQTRPLFVFSDLTLLEVFPTTRRDARILENYIHNVVEPQIRLYKTFLEHWKIQT